MRFSIHVHAAAAVAVLLCGTGFSQTLTPELKTKVDNHLKMLQGWGKDPTVVSAVKAHNTNPGAESKAMTQEKWATLSILDPFVRSFSKNPLAEYLKTKVDEQTSECFISGADGTKVAYLSKTTYWSHNNRAKHVMPMTGKTWTGPAEVDASSGQMQVQISVPVLDGEKPIGSIVVGLNVAKLK